MTSIGLRPALLFFSLAGVSPTASISARKLSNGTPRSIISSGSPFAEIAASRLSASKKLNCPIVPEPANREITNQTRTNPVEVAIFRGALMYEGQNLMQAIRNSSLQGMPAEYDAWCKKAEAYLRDLDESLVPRFRDESSFPADTPPGMFATN